MVFVALVATRPQPVLAQETGTVPIIKVQPTTELSHVRDNSTIPIITDPSQDQVTAPPSCSPDDYSFEVTITVNAAPSQATVIDLDTNHPDAIGLPSSVVVQPGSSTVTFTVSVTPGYAEHHKNVKINASANGSTATGKVRIDYHGEID